VPTGSAARCGAATLGGSSGAGDQEIRTVAVIKTIDLVGVSTESWRDAAHKALEEATKTLRDVEGFSVLDTSAVVEDGTIVEYHTHVRIRFRISR
jgi:dodecin